MLPVGEVVHILNRCWEVRKMDTQHVPWKDLERIVSVECGQAKARCPRAGKLVGLRLAARVP